jgi:hypothetical protein
MDGAIAHKNTQKSSQRGLLGLSQDSGEHHGCTIPQVRLSPEPNLVTPRTSYGGRSGDWNYWNL